MCPFILSIRTHADPNAFSLLCHEAAQQSKAPQACTVGDGETAMTKVHVAMILMLVVIVALLLLMSFYAFKWKRIARP